MNKALVEVYKLQAKRQKEFEKETARVTPAIYASIAIALTRLKNMSHEDIAEVFSESQKIWLEEYRGIEVNDMLNACFEETGIDMRSKEEDG